MKRKDQAIPPHHITDVVGAALAQGNRMATLKTIELIDALINQLKNLRAEKAASLTGTVPNPSAVTKVANYLALHPGTPRRTIAAHTGLNVTTVSKAIRALQAKGEVIHVGERRAAKWSLTSSLTNVAFRPKVGAHR